jgi:hypothetical protein
MKAPSIQVAYGQVFINSLGRPLRRDMFRSRNRAAGMRFRAGLVSKVIAQGDTSVFRSEESRASARLSNMSRGQRRAA